MKIKRNNQGDIVAILIIGIFVILLASIYFAYTRHHQPVKIITTSTAGTPGDSSPLSVTAPTNSTAQMPTPPPKSNVQVKTYQKGTAYVFGGDTITPQRYAIADIDGHPDFSSSSYEWAKLLDPFTVEGLKAIQMAVTCQLHSGGATKCPQVMIQTSDDLTSWLSLSSTNNVEEGTKTFHFDLTRYSTLKKYWRFIYLSDCDDNTCQTGSYKLVQTVEFE